MALINTDILDWNYKVYPVGYFDFIWSSPPCIEYSIAKTTGVKKIIEANRIVKKTREIIDYFKPKYWTIENPQTGLLKKQEFMEGLPYVLRKAFPETKKIKNIEKTEKIEKTAKKPLFSDRSRGEGHLSESNGVFSFFSFFQFFNFFSSSIL